MKDKIKGNYLNKTMKEKTRQHIHPKAMVPVGFFFSTAKSPRSIGHDAQSRSSRGPPKGARLEGIGIGWFGFLRVSLLFGLVDLAPKCLVL